MTKEDVWLANFAKITNKTVPAEAELNCCGEKKKKLKEEAD